MSRQIKCDYCDNKADAKVGDKPDYLCAKCWLKFYAGKPVHGECKEKKS